MAFKSFLAFLGFLTLFGAQCIRFSASEDGSGSGGGVFISSNRGQSWQQKVALPTPAGVKNFAGVSIATLASDPQDHLALYAGTQKQGLFYSFDRGESWKQPNYLRRGLVSAILVDPKDKCTIYAAVDNRIVKSLDCNRSFEEIYRESLSTTVITALTINPSAPQVLYAGTSSGALLKTTDGGLTWALKGNLKGKIMDLALDPRNPLVLLIAVKGKGVWRSLDGGTTFEERNETLKKVREALEARRLVADTAAPQSFIYASKNKLFRSGDAGLNWKALAIISPETVEIGALAVNPRDSQEIYYGTATTFYHSSDGGGRWSTEKLPTKRQASAIFVDAEEPQFIYLGVLEVKK